MNKSRLILVLSLLLCFQKVNAQVKDAGLWTHFTLVKKITPRFQLAYADVSRLNENMTHYYKHYSQLIAQYKITPDFSVSIAYRFGMRFTYDEQTNLRQRFQLDLNYNYKVKKITFGFQERLQSQYEDIDRSDNSLIPVSHLRSKLTLDYDLDRKIKPYCSAEVFLNLNELIHDKVRYKAGFYYKIDKYQTFNVYYIIDRQIQIANPLTNYVIGLGYKVTL